MFVIAAIAVSKPLSSGFLTVAYFDNSSPAVHQSVGVAADDEDDLSLRLHSEVPLSVSSGRLRTGFLPKWERVHDSGSGEVNYTSLFPCCFLGYFPVAALLNLRSGWTPAV